VTVPDEKPELFLPRTTAFFLGASLLLLLLFLAVLVTAVLLLHGLFVGGAPGD
jgi:hypothetical protein